MTTSPKPPTGEPDFSVLYDQWATDYWGARVLAQDRTTHFTFYCLRQAYRLGQQSAQPHQEQEVMPDTRGTRQHNATPPATPLAPGAALPDEIDGWLKKLRYENGEIYDSEADDRALANFIERIMRERDEAIDAWQALNLLHTSCLEVIERLGRLHKQAEAALADALRSNVQFEATLKDAQDFNDTLEAALTTAREKALEEAAVVCEKTLGWSNVGNSRVRKAAASIRAIKEQKP